jgi:hypothetical protein
MFVRRSSREHSERKAASDEGEPQRVDTRQRAADLPARRTYKEVQQDVVAASMNKPRSVQPKCILRAYWVMPTSLCENSDRYPSPCLSISTAWRTYLQDNAEAWQVVQSSKRRECDNILNLNWGSGPKTVETQTADKVHCKYKQSVRRLVYSCLRQM